MSGSHFGRSMGWGFGGGHFASRFEHGHRARSLAVPFGYYDRWYGGYCDPSTVSPDRAEDGGEASVNVVTDGL
jgi:hypothetical protein